MSCHWLLDLLEEHGWKEKADKVWAVIDKGLNSYAPTGMLTPSDPVIEPKFFIRVIQKSNGKIIDRRHGNHGEDQNIGLHDLVSQLSMCWVTTRQNVTVNGCTYLTPLDAGFCPFCSYHARCHKTLNNHIQLHFWMPMFCGVGDCFYATFDCNAMIPHAIEAHKGLYLKSKKINWIQDSSSIPELLLESRVSNSDWLISFQVV